MKDPKAAKAAAPVARKAGLGTRTMAVCAAGAVATALICGVTAVHVVDVRASQASSATQVGTVAADTVTVVPAGDEDGAPTADAATEDAEAPQGDGAESAVSEAEAAFDASEASLVRPDEPAVDAVVSTGPDDTVAYTVRKGDNLSSIAHDHGTTVEAVMAANPWIEDADVIDVDWVLELPL